MERATRSPCRKALVLGDLWDDIESFLKDYPSALSRLHFMGALNRQGPLIIEAPYGPAPSAFERAYRAIATALRAGSCPAWAPSSSSPAP
jgi:hypothetical protein